jgi:hypothetical protein
MLSCDLITFEFKKASETIFWFSDAFYESNYIVSWNDLEITSNCCSLVSLTKFTA